MGERVGEHWLQMTDILMKQYNSIFFFSVPHKIVKILYLNWLDIGRCVIQNLNKLYIVLWYACHDHMQKEILRNNDFFFSMDFNWMI